MSKDGAGLQCKPVQGGDGERRVELSQGGLEAFVRLVAVPRAVEAAQAAAGLPF
jgi:hypothetical protein